MQNPMVKEMISNLLPNNSVPIPKINRTVDYYLSDLYNKQEYKIFNIQIKLKVKFNKLH